MTAANSFGRRQFLRLAGAAALSAGFVAEQNAASKFRVIDTHFHIFNSALQGTDGIPRYMPDATVEHALEMMDQGGVDKAFLIGYNAEDIAAEIRFRGSSPATMLAVVNRQYQVAAWQAHRDRFWFFPGYVNPLHEGLIEDLERFLDQGAGGLKLLPLFHGLLPDHPSFRPVYDLCRRRNKPIILDLSWWLLGSAELGYGINESRERQKIVEGWKSWADYGKVLDPIVEEYRAVPFSLAHCGTAKKREDYEHIFAFIARHPNVSCDVGMIMDFSANFIEQLTGAVGAHKVMYGTDAPYWWKGTDSYRTARFRWTVIAEDCAFLSDAQKQAILAGNAERFVRNELPKGT